MPPVLLKSIQYRLSRVWTGGGGGQDYITYNRVILWNPRFESSNTKFVEGFGAVKFVGEAYLGTHQFRKQTSVPVMLYEFDRMQVIGDQDRLPQLRSWIALTVVPAGFEVGEHDIFSCRIRDIDASHGSELEAFNCTSLGTNTDIEFYDRDVRSVCGQRNALGARARLTPTPPPESVAGPLMDTV